MFFTDISTPAPQAHTQILQAFQLQDRVQRVQLAISAQQVQLCQSNALLALTLLRLATLSLLIAPLAQEAKSALFTELLLS